MMRAIAVMAVFMLSACSIETRHFRGVEPVQLIVDDSVFDVRVRGNLAEAIRTNPQYAPRLGPLRAQSAFAMALVSGCAVTGVLGDQAVMTGVLDCTTRTRASISELYDCTAVAEWAQAQRTTEYSGNACSSGVVLQ